MRLVIVYQPPIDWFDKSTYPVDPLCFANKPIPYEDCKRICLSTINALIRLVYVSSGPFVLYAYISTLWRLLTFFPINHKCTTKLVYSADPLCFTHKPIPYEDSKCICPSTWKFWGCSIYLHTWSTKFVFQYINAERDIYWKEKSQGTLSISTSLFFFVVAHWSGDLQKYL